MQAWILSSTPVLRQREERQNAYAGSSHHFGIPTELVIFLREPHSLRTEPRHAVDVLKWQIYWFERYMEGNQNAVKPNAETKDS